MLEIKNPITGEQLQVAEIDLEYQMNWPDAREACKNLGDRWRLPTKSELELIYKVLHEKGKGNFKNDKYWSNEEDVESYEEFVAWDLNFGDGNFYSNTATTCPLNVRAVRSV